MAFCRSSRFSLRFFIRSDLSAALYSPFRLFFLHSASAISIRTSSTTRSSDLCKHSVTAVDLSPSFSFSASASRHLEPTEAGVCRSFYLQHWRSTYFKACTFCACYSREKASGQFLESSRTASYSSGSSTDWEDVYRANLMWTRSFVPSRSLQLSSLRATLCSWDLVMAKQSGKEDSWEFLGTRNLPASSAPFLSS